MEGNEDIKQVLLDILAEGLLRIRVAGWAGRGDDCAVEADQLHNLPRTIRECTTESISDYYNIARPFYLKMVSKASRPEVYEPSWDKLRAFLVEAGVEIGSSEG